MHSQDIRCSTHVKLLKLCYSQYVKTVIKSYRSDDTTLTQP